MQANTALTAHRQSIFNRDGLPVSAEVLIRGTNFADLAGQPMAKRYPMEMRALRLACGVALSGGPHAINVTPRLLLEPVALDMLHGTLRLLPARALTIEVVEYDLIALDGLEQELSGLKRAGARIAVDDFGRHPMGIGLLVSDAHLIDEVKLDVSLVHCQRRDRLLPALVDLAHAAGAIAVAEHVDSAECLACVLETGVDRTQGFHLATPEPVMGLVPELLADQVMPCPVRALG